MDEPVKVLALIIANIGVIAGGGLLIALSYHAHRKSTGQHSYRTATFGFALIVLASLVEPAYVLGLAANFDLTASELLALETGEDVLLTAGLGLLFYAITRHDASSSSSSDARRSATDDGWTWKHYRGGDD